MVDLGRLRGIADDELAEMLAWRNAPEVRSNMYTRHEISLAEHLSWWDRVKVSDAHKYFMYEYKGIPSGVVGFVGVDKVHRSSSWAFYAAPKSVKGTGSRMEFLALDYAFDELDLNKLYCEVLAFNSSVVKLHQKFGFQVEGVLREQHLVESEFVDVYRLGILQREWSVIRQAMLEKLSKF
ncbi:UDP-4-amino-4,6-dideoxy-N-acetyl-beta-L-altrosamine N-acetyltransferase [Pseudomonas sp. V1]|uniref:UDP-4-amino-4, 6-dideoxy-N-acetyl-beta-L-altrosamine N-acetyltransferase n=1 Tax=Pseudomonas arcuscaelestis TaxID=2710591 RepID=UPI0019401A60|nr:UDP-4-amino-4,6-dideoxy-N-acetyl-beta-L-altrosamine N-acetyltransferase [Pseudomonas arcuscaelestis]MBM3106681.1 UDP-4-amino-4,6-dideoxy-N-acetyl-beta-L-altrosamine N-acetyltransferase [Pseudomonas arcuscaelestis]